MNKDKHKKQLTKYPVFFILKLTYLNHFVNLLSKANKNIPNQIQAKVNILIIDIGS